MGKENIETIFELYKKKRYLFDIDRKAFRVTSRKR